MADAARRGESQEAATTPFGQGADTLDTAEEHHKDNGAIPSLQSWLCRLRFRRRRTTKPHMRPGATVRATTGFTSNSAPGEEIPEGTMGRIAAVDTDGDALVAFAGISSDQWVYLENFHKLHVDDAAEVEEDVPESLMGLLVLESLLSKQQRHFDSLLCGVEGRLVSQQFRYEALVASLQENLSDVFTSGHRQISEQCEQTLDRLQRQRFTCSHKPILKKTVKLNDDVEELRFLTEPDHDLDSCNSRRDTGWPLNDHDPEEVILDLTAMDVESNDREIPLEEVRKKGSIEPTSPKSLFRTGKFSTVSEFFDVNRDSGLTSIPGEESLRNSCGDRWRPHASFDGDGNAPAARGRSDTGASGLVLARTSLAAQDQGRASWSEHQEDDDAEEEVVEDDVSVSGCAANRVTMGAGLTQGHKDLDNMYDNLGF